MFTPDSDEDEDHQHEVKEEEVSEVDHGPRTTLLVAPPTASISCEGVVVKEQPYAISPRRRAIANKMMTAAINAGDEPNDKNSSASAALLEEEDGGCGEVHPHERRAECYRLCTYDEAPPYLQHNPFIRTGYRVNFSVKLCLQSFFRLHNESWNVWTHFGGFVIFLVLAGVVMQQLDWRTPAEALLFLAFFLTVECSMLSSTVFHAFNCHSPCTYKWTCRLDYSSISMLLVGSYSPMLYYAFMCEPVWQRLYLSGFCILGVVGVVISFVPLFSTPQYTILRTGVFVALGWSTILPLPHIMYLHGVWLVWEVARWELLVGLIYTVGAVLYAKRIPERWSPGKYDTSFMCSHSLWHCFTIAGALTQLHACITVYNVFGTMRACS